MSSHSSVAVATFWLIQVVVFPLFILGYVLFTVWAFLPRRQSGGVGTLVGHRPTGYAPAGLSLPLPTPPASESARRR